MFRINFKLKKPAEITPWGELHPTLHWFGLTDKTLNNLFVEVLKLVWEEYRGILIDKDMVLPWFDVLGLTE